MLPLRDRKKQARLKGGISSKRWILPSHALVEGPVGSLSSSDDAVDTASFSSFLSPLQEESPFFDFGLAEELIQAHWMARPADTVINTLPSLLPGSLLLPSPTLHLALDTSTQYAGLPAVEPLTDADHRALGYFQKQNDFGFGNKDPSWSTHAILLKFGTQNPTVFHLLLAAALAEMAWKVEDCREMQVDAEKHYRIGCRLLPKTTGTNNEPDHLALMACFWLLFLQQRRRSLKQRIAYAELSQMMAEHVLKYRLGQLLASTEQKDTRQNSLIARLMVWLFWVDAQSCFEGEGGRLARQTFELASPSALTTGTLDLYECSRATLELHWGLDYPLSEIRDDIENASALELIHRTWVIVQELNEEGIPPNTDRPMAIGAKIGLLRRKFGSVFRLAEDPASPRDRLLGNADWAVCNFHALAIYHHRWSGEEAVSVTETVAALMDLIRKTLATGGIGQLDRVQWPLFWAGVETHDVYYQDWILARMTNRRLQAALQVMYQEQPPVGLKIGIDRIRQICQESCAEASISEVAE